MKRHMLWMSVFIIGTLALTGCKNDNLFGGLHDEGTGDATSLTADGQEALRTGDYATALGYFTRALDQNSASSEALYGAAVAKMGLAGLDIGRLIANIIGTNSTGFTATLADAAIRKTSSVETDPDSILYGMDAQALFDALEDVIPWLQQIKDGRTDGKIPPDNANLLINLGVSKLLRAISAIIKSGVVDVVKVGDDFVVDDRSSSDPSSYCGVYVEVKADAFDAAAILLQAVAKLGLASDSTIAELQADIDHFDGELQLKYDAWCIG